MCLLVYMMSQYGNYITDHIWELLEPHLPSRKGAWGGVAQGNRRFINAVLWILRTGAPWRDLPADYGDWKNTHRRFAVGAIKAYGRTCLRFLSMSPTLNGL